MSLREEISALNTAEIIKIKLSGNEKLTAVPLNFKGADGFCFEAVRNNMAFHENVEAENLGGFIENKLCGGGNAVIFTKGKTFEFKLTKKGSVLKNSYKNDLDLNKSESFNLPLDIPALVDLGLVTREKKPVAAMKDKLVQVQLFTELIYNEIKDYKTCRIIDCGCGKAYLSFVLYHFLKYEKNIDVEITGIDLKKDVIDSLNETAKRYGYDNMKFECKNIFDASFKGADMLISLHACDKATDYALYNAIKNDVKIIFAAPCCQHEVNLQFSSKTLPILNQYGTVKERISALYTDAVRASLLTSKGYKTKIAEFVPLAHSPKNLMIKAIKSNISSKVRKEAYDQAKTLLDEINSTQELMRLLTEEK